MHKKILLSLIFAYVSLIPNTTNVGAGDVKPIRGNSAVLEIKGDTKKALKALKEQGISSVELTGETYVLPTVTLDGPTSVKSGSRMVTVSANLSRDTLPDNILAAKFQWTVLVDGIPNTNTLVWPDGTKIIFGSSDKPSNTTVVLDVDCLYGVKNQAVIDGKQTEVYTSVETNSADLQVFNIKVEDANPCPPIPTPTPNPPQPPPAPTPDPVEPSLPDGKYGLAKISYDAFVKDTQMTADQKYKAAHALGSSFKSVADKIGDSYKSFDQILSDAASANKLALSVSGVPESATSIAQKAIGDKVYQLCIQSKQITTADDLKVAFTEISTGLLAVPKPN